MDTNCLAAVGIDADDFSVKTALRHAVDLEGLRRLGGFDALRVEAFHGKRLFYNMINIAWNGGKGTKKPESL